MNAFDGYVAHRLIDEHALGEELSQMRELMDGTWRVLDIEQDLGLGMMLWLSCRPPQARACRHGLTEGAVPLTIE